MHGCTVRNFIFLFTCLFSAASHSQSADESLSSMQNSSDVQYAQKLWMSMERTKIVGPSAVREKPFFGGAKPHGMILELAYKTIDVGGHRGFVVVKKNYDGSGVTVDRVIADRKKYLASMTVMYRREAGYDEDNQNWFWVKYHPDGSIFQKMINGSKFYLAGRLMKGKTPDENGGCIYCHASAGGGDYVFYPEITVPSPE